MACPTCDHTMTAMGCQVSGGNLFHCPRCGTIKTCDGFVCAPDIVRRTRRFEYEVAHSPFNPLIQIKIFEIWKKTGCAEAVAEPEQFLNAGANI